MINRAHALMYPASCDMLPPDVPVSPLPHSPGLDKNKYLKAASHEATFPATCLANIDDSVVLQGAVTMSHVATRSRNIA